MTVIVVKNNSNRLAMLALPYIVMYLCALLLHLDSTYASPAATDQTRGAIAGTYSVSYDLRQRAKPRCPRGFQREPQHVRRCFKPVFIKASWISAKGYCEAMNAVLAEVTSQEEHQFLADEIKSHLLWRPALKQQRQQFWLGATDLAFEGQWRWIADNRPIDGAGAAAAYTNWGSRQPDMKRKHEHCMAMKATANGVDYKWHDINCIKHNYFICYKKLDQ